MHDCNNYAVRRVVTEVCKNPKACYRYNIKLNLSMNRRFGEPRPFTLTGMPGRTECALRPGLAAQTGGKAQAAVPPVCSALGQANPFPS